MYQGDPARCRGLEQVFHVSSDSNHPMVPWSSTLHSSWDRERIFWRSDALLIGIFHHQVWSDFSHPRSFSSSVWISCLHTCPKCSRSGYTLFWEDIIPTNSMVWSHLWLPLSKGSKQASKPSSKSPSQRQGRPSAIAGTHLWQNLQHMKSFKTDLQARFHHNFLIFYLQAC